MYGLHSLHVPRHFKRTLKKYYLLKHFPPILAYPVETLCLTQTTQYRCKSHLQYLSLYCRGIVSGLGLQIAKVTCVVCNLS